MNKALVFLEKFTAVLTIFLLPTQLALHFWPSYSFVFGIRVDYLSPAIFLTDLLIVGLAALFLANDRKDFFVFLKKSRVYIFALILFALINTVFSGAPQVSAYKWAKVFEALFLATYIYLRKYFVGERNIFTTVFSSAVLFSLIGIWQFFLGRTTNFFYIFGERTFNLSTPGIALAQIAGGDYLRAYSTFPHPNALGGYLGMVLLFVLSSKFFGSNKIYYLGILSIGLAFLLTFSTTAFLALLILIIFTFLKISNKTAAKLIFIFLGAALLASLLLPVFSELLLKTFHFSSRLQERLDLSYISGGMIADRFLTGEGLGTFIINSVKFRGVEVYSWLLQPVHNIFLLVFTETGVVGLLGLSLLFHKIIKFAVANKLLFLTMASFFVLFTGLTDHYWLTLQQNLLFASLIFGYSLRLKK